ncbi:hypothetical protein P175DRAFT_0529693 [Aspergillus ochraceoroseus IBT 24754]|uniref:REJ domain-containing protein n=1 Tax=Aspergillus ochraceoroseus IBT 24754 TaxID=1392256 RepID=A0A2T5M254_9EURO|nr:uncharacterized protein P175DRAFT_0529693 [Aspergillus ochraceoroseus IBT 24754]PTU22620.1 hypothetical protein P175DRAFT_0529693 [Aspergillus ochraceoroseus IBT 24754]
MRYSILLVTFSALALAQSSAPVATAVTSQPLIPTAVAPSGAASTVVASSSGITTTTSSKHHSTTSADSSSTTDSSSSTSSSSSSSSSSSTTTSSTNGAYPLATGGSLGLSAGLAGAALVAFL